MKKVFTVILVLLIGFGIYKLLVLFKDMVPEKEPIETVKENIDSVYSVVASSYIRSAEDYCQMEMVKGNPRVERITNPNEVKTRAETPKEVDLTFSEDCKVTGTVKYKNTVYKYENGRYVGH